MHCSANLERALLHLAGALPPPYNMTATAPLGIPAVFSLAFWGGVWGIPVWLIIKQFTGARYWAFAALIGALGPSLVALAIVFPLKGLPFMAGWAPEKIIGALLLNAAWGIGLALFMRLFNSRS